jgi:hypothetical protein
VPQNPKTYHAIILSLQGRYFSAQLLRRGPWLRQYLINELRNGVCAHIDGPRQIGHSIVLDDVSEMAAAQYTKIRASAGVPDIKVNESKHIPALHSISPHCAAREHAIARTHRDRIRRVPYVRDVVRRRLKMFNGYKFTHLKWNAIRTGDGRCKRCAAIRSPGGSNVTTGTPNVTPRRDATEPPRECPMTHIVASGNMKVMLL